MANTQLMLFLMDDNCASCIMHYEVTTDLCNSSHILLLLALLP